MCGIAGFIERNNNTDARYLAKMLAGLRHRGPDAGGTKVFESGNWAVHVGHRRLSIIDIEGGAQPMSNEDGTEWIVFNGEIFNFQELRGPLESSGHIFKSRADTEVIIHHYEEHREKGICELNGMFAYAIWDGKRGELILARDRSGIKPLYYAPLPEGGIIFSSELLPILAHPKISKAFDLKSLSSFFFSDYIPAPQCILQNVRKLQPGHFLKWRDGLILEPRRFWRLHEPQQASPMEMERLTRTLLQNLSLSVQRQLTSDVPVGVFLSGGIDSSLIAAMAQKHNRMPIKTFTIAFKEKDYDESFYARMVACHLKTDHIEESLGENNLLENLNNALNVLDEPLADPSIIPTYLLCRLASRHVKVVLGGDGGDELWGGYPTYKAHCYANHYSRFPGFFRDGLIRNFVSTLKPRLTYQSLDWKIKRFALRWDDSPIRRHFRWMSNTDVEDLHRLLPTTTDTPGFLSENLFQMHKDFLNSFLAIDFQTYLPGSVLAKVDRASMANGLEVRPPFLDNGLIDWAFSIPSCYKVRRGTTKFLLKKAAENCLPKSIVHRRKRGFAIPLGRWLNGPLKPRLMQILSESPLWEGHHICRDTLSRWQKEHAERKEDYSRPLWAIFVLDHWMRKVGIHVIKA